jgi:hypothetical protein
VANSGGLIARTAQDHYVRDVNRRLSLDNPPLDVLGGISPGMTLQQTDSLDNDSVFVSDDSQDTSHFVETFACDYLDLIILANAHSARLFHFR